MYWLRDLEVGTSWIEGEAASGQSLLAVFSDLHGRETESQWFLLKESHSHNNTINLIWRTESLEAEPSPFKLLWTLGLGIKFSTQDLGVQSNHVSAKE